MYGVTMPLPGESAYRFVKPTDGRSFAVVESEGLIAVRQQNGIEIPGRKFKGEAEQLIRLMTTEDGAELVRRKVILDVNEGREDVPLLYGLIYDRMADDNMPRTVDTNIVAEADVVFLSRFEGEEAIFGGLSAGVSSSFPILNWSAGFAWTREHRKYNETFRIERFNQGFGRAYNALCNHLHLGPILAYTYGAPNITAADATGATLIDRFRLTLQNGLRAASLAERPASILLANSAQKYNIEDAIARRTDNNGNVLPALDGIGAIIYYDGWSATVNGKTYSYPGVSTTYGYLIRPKRKFVEAIATEGGQDLIVVTGNPDVSRGIEAQMVGHTYRGVYADIAGSVQRVTWPT